MRIHAILHAAFEPLGIIEYWANERKHHLQISRPFAGDELPNPSSFELLLLMGGPQSSLELEKYPYLMSEIDLIRNSVRPNKKILGVCLGAQLLGHALGAKPKPSPKKEIGIFPIELTQDAKQDDLFDGLPNKFDVMHWHNDMPGLPKGAIVLAKSAGCPRQVIRFLPNIYGFQCHFEINRPVAEGLIAKCPEDLKPAIYVQSAEQILKANFDGFNNKMKTLLDRLSDT